MWEIEGEEECERRKKRVKKKCEKSIEYEGQREERG